MIFHRGYLPAGSRINLLPPGDQFVFIDIRRVAGIIIAIAQLLDDGSQLAFVRFAANDTTNHQAAMGRAEFGEQT